MTTASCLLGSGLLLDAALAHAHGSHHHDDYYYGGGALFGGMLANQMLTNMDMQYDAERRPDPVQYGDHADHRTMIEREQHPYQRTAASRMAALDQLAASGAVSAKEYQDKRLAIIDGL